MASCYHVSPCEYYLLKAERDAMKQLLNSLGEEWADWTGVMVESETVRLPWMSHGEIVRG